MAKGKGKEVAAKPDWKDQLAMLDQEMGWDEDSTSDWADSCEAKKDEEHTPSRPPNSQHTDKNFTQELNSTEQDHLPCSETEQDGALGVTTTPCDQTASHGAQKYPGNARNHASLMPSDSLEDAEVTSTEMQRTLWNAAVEESRTAACADPAESLYDDDDDDLAQNSAAQQQKPREGEDDEAHDEADEEEEEQSQPKSKLEQYLYHRFGPDLNYKNRCRCHERLYDCAEEGKKRNREHFARAGGTSLIKDPCVLLPYPQDDIPGTADVEKPALMVTTPEGEALYPHDMGDYPEPPAASWHGPRIRWAGRAPPQGEYVVPYEDEDGADI